MLKSKKRGDTLTVYLIGEIDHCSATILRQELETLLKDPSIRRLHLDFSEVSFIDSSAIGMIIGRYKTMLSKGGEVTAASLSGPVERLFRMGGLHRIIPIIPSIEGDAAHG